MPGWDEYFSSTLQAILCSVCESLTVATRRGSHQLDSAGMRAPAKSVRVSIYQPQGGWIQCIYGCERENERKSTLGASQKRQRPKIGETERAVS